MIKLKNILLEKSKNPKRMKQFIDDFIIDKKKSLIKIKKSKTGLTLHKSGFAYLEQSLNAIINSSTKQIKNRKFSLKDYNKNKKTINFNEEEVKVQTVRNMIRVANHVFNLN